MRHLPKTDTAPPDLAEFREAQELLGYNMTYDCFSRAGQFCEFLVAEQFGLCGYTGVALDDRLMAVRKQTPAILKPHIEHLKSQRQCREELTARGLAPGTAWGEDMDHRNMIAALEVSLLSDRGHLAHSGVFGAAARRDAVLPVWPTHPDCEPRFSYDTDGNVRGLDAQAQRTCELLNLNHPTLKAWRQAALDGYFSPDDELTRAELTTLIAKFNVPEQGQLPEFSFVLKSVAESLLLPP